jgi:tetratricopeptide (TPR) repeat protein
LAIRSARKEDVAQGAEESLSGCCSRSDCGHLQAAYQQRAQMQSLERQLKRLEWRWQRQGVLKWEAAAVKVQALHRGNRGRAFAKVATHSRLMRRRAQEACSKADALARNGHYDEALQLVQVSFSFDAAYSAALVLHSRFLHQRGQYTAAVREAGRALVVDSDDTTAALWCRARCYAKLEQWEPAVADLSKLVRLKPRDADAFLLRGHCCMQLDDLDGALFDFNAVIELRGSRATADDLLRHSLVQCCLQDYRAAEHELTELSRRREEPQVRFAYFAYLVCCQQRSSNMFHK